MQISLHRMGYWTNGNISEGQNAEKLMEEACPVLEVVIGGQIEQALIHTGTST